MSKRSANRQLQLIYNYCFEIIRHRGQNSHLFRRICRYELSYVHEEYVVTTCHICTHKIKEGLFGFNE